MAVVFLLVMILTLTRIGSEERALYLVGLRPGQRIGPWELAAGRARPERGEAVVPEVLARRGGVGLEA